MSKKKIKKRKRKPVDNLAMSDKKREKPVAEPIMTGVNSSRPEYVPWARSREIQLPNGKSIWCLELTPLEELQKYWEISVSY